ncbi:aspartic peptidase domain-containing protein [Lophiotrema nucula]|uniref:Aspartic peptidase domain-containing protein n=1 Tax=Lophiotrema nucula TaxID=690887 RepID=A0A6A5Z3I7_9PLEO|nr:aspartic peptidase domain-containing protein [Lophiotrema nucula]
MKLRFMIAAVAALTELTEAGVLSLPITRTSIGLFFNDFQSAGHAQSQLHSTLNHVANFRSPQESQWTWLKKDQSIFWDWVRTEPSAQARILDDDDDDLEAMYWSIYTTPLSIGNPALNLDAIVDTSWSVLFIPSVNCTYDAHEVSSCAIHPLYNSSYSTTYQPNSTPTNVHYKGPAGLLTWGSISQDSLHVGDLEVKEQLFEEAVAWHGDVGTYDAVFDTVLGLSLFPTLDGYRNTNFTTVSPFQNMMKQTLLDENVFTLQYPRTDQERGSITFGGLPPGLQRDEMIEVPLNNNETNDSDHIWRYYTMNGWQVSMDSMSMTSNVSENSTAVLDAPQIAIVSSSFPWIGLPDDAAEKIHKAIGLKHAFDWLDCEKRADLPNWTVTFGSDPALEITLTPWDYLIEMYDQYHQQLKCVSPFYNLSEYGDKGFVILGASFLNGLYTVFDADRKSISFKNRPL